MNQPSSCPSWAKIYAAVPIKKSTKSIRLLTFHRSVGRFITGYLKTYDLANLTIRPEWIALSYTWDSYELVEYDMRKRSDRGAYVIDIQGVEVPVRENLWLALDAILEQRARHGQVKSKRQSRYMEFINKEEIKVTSSLSQDDALFWIDAICIYFDRS